MEIIPIFDDKLYAFKFDNEELDEFEKSFELWADPTYLIDFFEKNKDDLTGDFYKIESVQDAAMATIDEALEFQQLILEKAEQNDLNRLFKNLDNKQYRTINYETKKAYGTEHKSWLRVYAIQVEGIFLITGSAIKLTATMQEAEHTKKELAKLQQCKAFLVETGICDLEGIKEMEL